MKISRLASEIKEKRMQLDTHQWRDREAAGNEILPGMVTNLIAHAEPRPSLYELRAEPVGLGASPDGETAWQVELQGPNGEVIHDFVQLGPADQEAFMATYPPHELVLEEFEGYFREEFGEITMERR